MSNLLDKIDTVDLDAERITRILMDVGVNPKVIDIFVQQNDQMRALQSAVNDLLKQNIMLVEALTLVNKGFKGHADQLRKIASNYSDPNRDLINDEEIH